MYHFMQRILIGLFVVLLVSGLSPIQAEHFAQGDFDKDGDVDFADFLVFSNNYGKPITQQTLVKHTLDTIIVRDTITVNNISDSEAGKRAGRMLGFWYLNYEYRWVLPDVIEKYYEYEIAFIFTTIDPVPNEDGEYSVHGKFLDSDDEESAHIRNVTVFYSQSEQKYILRAPKAISVVQTFELYELECAFRFEDNVHPDMTDRLNSRIDRYTNKIPEPTAIIDYVVAIRLKELRPTSSSYETITKREVTNAKIRPINDGLRRANREEFMTTFTDIFNYREVRH